ncbi:helix-turn-helix domain-containing protein [Nocardioides sp. WS12]|uniref:PucR family transcriptional regulator n=1 Tax=Nocardioides sp. WS12 TaxID=2486272 RepID=UPI0015FCBEF9|nr:helix-turn-helix domain-containing protein [Nocardioides sp. WS12]
MTVPRDLHAEVLAWVERRSTEILTSDGFGDLVRLVDDEISACVPEVGTVPALREILDVSTSAALLLYLEAITRELPGTIGASTEMRELARGLAARGVDLAVLLRLYRVGQRVIWQEFMRQVHHSGLDEQLQVAVLEFLWDSLSRNLERIVDDVVAAHTAESEQRLRGSFARRAETVEAILAGDAIDPSTAETLLGYPVQRHQVAAILWLPAEVEHADATGRLERLARSVGESVEADQVLTIQSGARTLWAWLTTGRRPDLDSAAHASGVLTSPDIRIALGEPAPGLVGFRSSHRQAVRAQQVAASAAHPTQVTRYADVELVSLLAEDQEAMASLVARTLGRLAEDDATCARLRETLLAYLHEGSSAKAAGALTVHKNTVLYRLQQAEQLLGHPIDERQFEVEAALRLVAAYGISLLVR